jgi:hypothetical protein
VTAYAFAYAGVNGRSSVSSIGSGGRGTMFKVPSDDEDDAMGDDITPSVSGYASQLSPSGAEASTQQRWSQQQQVFVFSSGPSSQPGPVENMLWEHTRKLQAYALREAGGCWGGVVDGLTTACACVFQC